MKTKLVFLVYSLGQRYHSLRKCRLITDKRGFGMNELLGIAAAVILAAFIVIPGLRLFANTIMVELGEWWSDTIDHRIFPST